VFMLVGADAQKMEKLRVAMSAMTRGWNRDQVASIVREALTDVIEPIIYAEALELFDEHHAAGHKIVIISSSPVEVVEPLAEFLGADEHVDDLGVETLHDRAPRQQAFLVEGLAERQHRALGDDRLVEVEERGCRLLAHALEPTRQHPS